MKRKIALSLALLLCSVLCLASCLMVPGTTPEPENMIYRADSELYIAVGDSALKPELIDGLYNAVSVYKTKSPLMSGGFREGAHNILLGRSSAQLSVDAYKRLEALCAEDEIGYLIYSDGSSVCIAYSESENRLAAEFAFKYFKENYLSEQLIAPAGVLYSYAFNADEYFQEQDDILVEEGWKKLAEVAGQDVATAMRDLYSIYDDSTVDWLANLYDPGIGGWYHTNSAKNTYGYLPDAESTAKMLGFLNSSGMVDNYADALPEEMKKKIGDFLYGLQDPDGYFYHPQWGKEISLSKRGRDLNWCTSVLKAFGRTPKYETITGVGGEDQDDMMTSFITGSLGGGTVVAVSRVIAAEESEKLIPEHLQSEENFLTYLEAMNINKSSYSRGNELSSQIAQIKAQKLDGVLIDFLTSKQYEHNGLWHQESNHYGVNGLMKICGVYNSCKQAMPNAEKAAMAAIDALIGEEVPKDVICIYNPWVSIARLTKNQTQFGGAEGAAVAQRITESIRAVAPAALAATKANVSRFIVDDTVDNTKSFSYNLGRAASGIQGAPAAVPGLYEGDLGGTNNACAALVNNIYEALKISAYHVPIYTYSDFRRFLSIIEDLDPIQKLPGEVTADDPQDFDDFEHGEDVDVAEIGTRNVSGQYGDFRIESDPRGEGSVAVYKQHSKIPDTGSGAYVTFRIDNALVTNVCSVLEMDLCVDEVTSVPTNGIIARFEMGREAYRIELVMSNGKLQLWERSIGEYAERNDLGVSVEQGEWFNLRVEYYLGDHDTVRIKVFFNDECIAISDNYYTGDGNPSAKYREVYLYVVKSTVAKFGFDDVNGYNCTQTYTYEEPVLPGAINVDAPDREERVYDFEDEQMPSDLPVEGTTVLKDGALEMAAGSSMKIPVNLVKAAGNAVELRYNVTVDGSGTAAKMTFIERNSTANPVIALSLKSDGNTVSVLDSTGSAIAGATFDTGVQTELSFILFEDKDAALIYIDGYLVGVTTAMSAGGESLAAFFVKFAASSAITIDDLACQRISLNYDTAVGGGGSSDVHDFESGKGDVDSDGSLVTVGGGKKLSLEGDNMSLPVVNTAAVSTATFAEMKLTLASVDDDGELYRIALVDEEGAPIIAFALVCENGVVTLREQTARGTHAGDLYELVPGEEIALAFEYFPDEGVCNIFVDGTCVFASCMSWSSANAALVPAALEVSPLEAVAEIYLDDLKAENVVAAYEQESIGGYSPDLGTHIGFETSCPQRLPVRVTTSIKSSGGKLSIVEAMINDQLTKALSITSAAGAQDQLALTLDSPISGTTVLEMDIKASPTSSGSAFQIWLYSGDSPACLLSFKLSGSNVLMKVSSASSGSGLLQSEEVVLSAKNKWANLRVEYAENGNVKVYVDGEQVIDCACFFGAHNGTAPRTGVTSVQLRTYKDATGTIAVDNIFLGKAND